jgi:hypothetical protein
MEIRKMTMAEEGMPPEAILVVVPVGERPTENNFFTVHESNQDTLSRCRQRDYTLDDHINAAEKLTRLMKSSDSHT